MLEKIYEDAYVIVRTVREIKYYFAGCDGNDVAHWNSNVKKGWKFDEFELAELEAEEYVLNYDKIECVVIEHVDINHNEFYDL